MSTRSWIIGQINDTQAVRITCHRDSHSWELGQRLRDHYHTQVKMRSLLRHGDALDIQETVKLSTFFHRDLQRPMHKKLYPGVADAIRDFNPIEHFNIEYVYVMWPGPAACWSIMTVSQEGLSEPAPVSDEIIAVDIAKKCHPDDARLIEQLANANPTMAGRIRNILRNLPRPEATNP